MKIKISDHQRISVGQRKINIAQFNKMLLCDYNNGQIISSNINEKLLNTLDLGVPY